MKTNLSEIDKRIRLGAGILLLLVSIFFQYFITVILGVYALLTGFMGWCPFNKIFNIDTNLPAAEKKHESNVPLDSDR
ncbi:MAG: hypothetical protein A2231_08595 [Candidatus Firestonebacteria bacterium RIFOXYA2_FULL_40_8]|nr:MAG: hypothetical protein A2231_08595 [Candidatus Firestonebacteria bacterium RIFOXYA2_FULL_40_8]